MTIVLSILHSDHTNPTQSIIILSVTGERDVPSDYHLNPGDGISQQGKGSSEKNNSKSMIPKVQKSDYNKGE